MPLNYSSISGSSGAAINDFSINVGTSGYTNVSLSTTFPVGSYICTSSLADTSLDIYFINQDGTNAGYANATTATTTITATKSFNKVVVYGTTNNDTLSFQFKYVFSPTNVTDNYLGAAPIVTSTSVSSLPNQNDTTVLTGQNFATDVTVTFTGSDSVARSAKSIVRSSSTSLIVTRPDSLPTTYSPYTITVTNPGISSPTSTNLHKLTNSTTAGSAPVWVTAAALTNYRVNEAYSTTISATDADGGSSVIYSVVSGSLPSGITFNTSTGIFSGTATTNSGTPYTYTVRATDSGNNYVDRSFTLAQVVPDSPTIGTATNVGTSRPYNNGAATVTFTPAVTGPSATSYTVTAYQSGTATGLTATGSSSPLTVTGLSSNIAYTFLVKATNASGDSLNSSQTSSVTITTVPDAPTISSISRTNDTTVSVAFTAGANGGSAITSYTMATTPSLAVTVTGTSSPLSASASFSASPTTYTATLTAVNANGSSIASTASSAFNPAAYILAQTFNSSGTFTVPAGKNLLTVIGIGAGGGGGAGKGTGNNGDAAPGGAAGGKFSIKDIPVTPGSNYTVTIGTGGNGGSPGAARNDSSFYNGNQGGQTSFGNIITANGGIGPIGNVNNATWSVATGGNVTYNAGTADVATTGASSGLGGNFNTYWTGATASSYNAGSAGGSDAAINSSAAGVSSLSVGGGGGGGGAGTLYITGDPYPATSGGTLSNGGSGGNFGGGAGGAGGWQTSSTQSNAGSPGSSGAASKGGGGGGGGAGAYLISSHYNPAVWYVGAGGAGGSGGSGTVYVYTK